MFTPSCFNGVFPDTEQWESRTICCGNTSFCDPKFLQPALKKLPPYTVDGQRSHHHVHDGAVAGNGNVGVVLGSGNPQTLGAGPAWIDFFISTNSFWAVQVSFLIPPPQYLVCYLSPVGLCPESSYFLAFQVGNHSSGTPFRGRIALPGTMQMGVARLILPPDWNTTAYNAVQDVDEALIHVNLTNADGVKLCATIWVSPIAPVIWTEITVVGSATPIALALNTTVLKHFYHREASYNATFPTPTTALCAPETNGAVVTRASDYVGSNASVTGVIQHAIRGSPTPECDTSDSSSTVLRFSVSPTTTTVVSTVVRTSRDPTCVPLPGEPLNCGFSTNPVAAAASISAAVQEISVKQARLDHDDHWAEFWNTSSISLPQAPLTEDFWYGAQVSFFGRLSFDNV